MLEADREIGVERLHEASPSSISRCTASNTKVDNRMAVSIGCFKSDLDTPALCIDLDAMESNAAEMSQACRDRNLAWRPHSKCHKSPDIGRKLVQAGAIGLTCAKLGEAEAERSLGPPPEKDLTWEGFRGLFAGEFPVSVHTQAYQVIRKELL